jgi:NhaP-type Na+/H+ or K+/H+ antiporter
MLTAVFVTVVFLYSLVSRRLEPTIITVPVIFTVVGFVIMLAPPWFTAFEHDRNAFLLIAEIGLVMTLFTDASHVNLTMLRENGRLLARLLSAGMLLTIMLGAIGALVVVGDLSLWEAGILAAILAPTDAGLGHLIVSSSRVPARIRHILNVEAGLNDGLCVPFLMLFIALALRTEERAGAVLLRFLAEQLGYGALIGLGIGLIGGWLLGFAERRKWMAEGLQQLGLVAVPLLCVMASEAVHASMFIAAFLAGLVVQIGFHNAGKRSTEFTENWGQLLNLFVFFLFGLFVARVWTHFTVALILYAVLSLTLIRMIPVALALAGTGLSPATLLFVGWFGPRGLASIVLGLVYLERHANLPGESTIRLAVMATVLVSIFAHGLSAMPGIELYARRIACLSRSAPEHQATDEKLAWDPAVQNPST